MQLYQGILGAVNGVSGLTASANTAIVGKIIPFPGRLGAGGFLEKVSGSNQQKGRGITHITTVIYTTGATAHLVQIARPFNFSYLTTAIAANGTALVLKTDPGAYAASYNYPIPNGKPAQVADNLMAASDYVMIQLVDGTWHLSTIASGSGTSFVLTTAVPNVTGGGAAIGAPCFFYGQITTDVNPLTNQANPGTTFASGGTRASWTETTCGIVSAFNPGDPLLIYSPNTTNAGTVDSVSGFYASI